MHGVKTYKASSRKHKPQSRDSVLGARSALSYITRQVHRHKENSPLHALCDQKFLHYSHYVSVARPTLHEMNVWVVGCWLLCVVEMEHARAAQS